MKSNVVSVLLWGKEICKIMWEGGYRQGFGKVGSRVSFNPDYHAFGFDVDPLGAYNQSVYLVRKGLSDICREAEYEGLPRFLSGSLPDDWGNDVFSLWIERNGIRSHDVTSVDKLAFIGKRGMGGFEFVPQMYNHSADDSLVLEDLYALAKVIEANREGMSISLQDNPSINDLMSVGMSAGGIHPKAIVAINWQTSQVKSGQMLLPEDYTHYILKFRDSNMWPTAEIEYVYYQMALRCGIEMEKSQLLKISGINHFLTERFDRKNGNKVHSATLRSLCGEIRSYDDIFKVCRKLHLPYHDIDQLFRRAVFNYLAGVTDDHDKNFSFTMTRDCKWHLSPAYDVTFTVNYKNPFYGDRHYMAIEECDRNISQSQFIRLADGNDVKNPLGIISEVSDAVMSFSALAAEAGISDVFMGKIQSYISAQTDKLL